MIRTVPASGVVLLDKQCHLVAFGGSTLALEAEARRIGYTSLAQALTSGHEARKASVTLVYDVSPIIHAEEIQPLVLELVTALADDDDEAAQSLLRRITDAYLDNVEHGSACGAEFALYARTLVRERMIERRAKTLGTMRMCPTCKGMGTTGIDERQCATCGGPGKASR